MGSLVRKHWPVIAASAILTVVLLELVLLSLQLTGGRLIYALDDAYIHMAMARHFAEDHVWGITRYEFSSSSSSPVWTLLIVVSYFVFGVNEITPFILAALCAVLTLVVTSRLTRGYGFSSKTQFVMLLSIVLVAPLPSLVFTGQEHVLHILLTLAFVSISARTLAAKEYNKPYSLCVLAALMTMVRYESLFIIAIVCLLFAIRRRWLYSLILGVCTVLPVAAYGLISKYYGWFILPNSVVLKGSTGLLHNLTSPEYIALYLYFTGKTLMGIGNLCGIFIFAVLAGFLYWRINGWVWTPGRIMLAVFTFAVVMHALFARFGHFHRYEAYLVVLGAFALYTLLAEVMVNHNSSEYLKPQSFSANGLMMLTSALLLISAIFGITITSQVPSAARDIYEQQYQMGLFCRQFYQGAVIGANDIGAINYLADVRCIDLVGLANREIAHMKLEDGYNEANLSKLSDEKGMTFAVIYDSWLGSAIPDRWEGVGHWRIMERVVAAGDTVSFYSADPLRTLELKSNLHQFSSRLPGSVVQSGEYLKTMD